VLFAFCHGNTGFQFAYPLSAASVHIDMTTTGIPAVAGLILTALGAFLLIVTTIIAIFTMRRSSLNTDPIKRRDTAFEE
jgi:hypothetical protein